MYIHLKKIKYLFFSFLLLSIVGWGPFSWFSFGGGPNDQPLGTQAWLDKEVKIIQSQADNLDSNVLRLALIAYMKTRQQGYNQKELITIIDYSKPSSERRLWVADIKNGKVLFNTWVSHGKNSGNLNATSFSNQHGSLKSSLGVFLTDNSSYMGGNGYSLRLKGLEKGVNDNAYNRAVVIHGAWYADPKIVKQYGQLGRSWGCPAVKEDLARPIIDTIKNETLVFTYSNDQKWLKSSRFLAFNG